MKNTKITKTFILIIVLFIGILSGCTEQQSFHTIYLEEAFSIVPYVSIYEGNTEFEKHSFDIKTSCNKALQELDDKFNVNKENSMISNVNNNVSTDYVKVDKEFYDILSFAVSTSKNVSSKYDPTIYSLSLTWDFKNQYYKGNNYGTIPSTEAIDEALDYVDYNYIELSDDNNEYKVKFSKLGVKIDLGSIVKGYAADLLEDILKQYNVNIGIINIGGNIITFGDKEINVGITTPFNEELNQDCNIIGVLKINNADYTFVTTGVYERYIKTSDNKMYHHILDKETGYPIDNDLYSVTIVSNKESNKSMEADALSTAIYTLGLTDGIKYCSDNNIEAVFITKDKEIVLTDSIKALFSFNKELSAYGYKVKNND